MPRFEAIECTEKQPKSWHSSPNTLGFDRDSGRPGVTRLGWEVLYVPPYGGRYAPGARRDTVGE